MKKVFINILLIIFIFSAKVYSQLYQGPAAGTVPSGVMVSTNNFSDVSSTPSLPPYVVKGKTNEEIPESIKDYFNKIKPTGPEGTNFVQDLSAVSDNPPAAPSLLLKNYQGVPQTGFIPPDAYICVGPTHIIGAVNSTFRIWDRDGNIIRTITAASWLSSLGLGIGQNVSDPKVTYDHFAKRWVMTWITPPIGPFAYDVVSVSDDSIPLGNWYNYAMRDDLLGSTPADVWRDYQGVGYDENAIYITGNGFTISSSSYVYPLLRIINKSQLYANTGGQVSWYDMWAISDAAGGSAFGIRPSLTYGTPGEFYLLNAGFSGGSYISLYKLINPLASPSMTAVVVPVVAFSPPPNSGQLGSTSTITAGNTSGFRSEPVFRNGYVHGVHAVRSDNVYSAFKYYKINVSTNTAEQDATFGAPGFYYSYPALSVDNNQNVIVTYSRSGTTEYIGAAYTSRLNSDPPNTFNPSSWLKPGKGVMVTTRWGDYMGSWLDPSNGDEFYIMTEYAELNSGWGVWVGNVKLTPFPTARIFSNKDSLVYGNWQVGTTSDTQTVRLLNFGNTNLSISNIQVSNPEFQILNSLSYPVNLPFNDSLVLRVVLKPTSAGIKTDSLNILSNDPTNPNLAVYLKGKGFSVNPVAANVIYGVTGAQSGGILLTINSSNGTGTSVGPSGFAQLNGASVQPSTNIMFATVSGSLNTQLVRVNASGGDAYLYSLIPFANLRAIAFDTNGDLFCSSSDGKIYKYNLTTYDTMTVGSTGISNLLGISINPVNGQLWGMSSGGSVYKINKGTAASQLIGTTGQTPNSDIAFDKNGKLYGIKGLGVTVNSLISIDTANGAGTLIGSVGFAGINGIAISPDMVGIQNISTAVPDKFELFQNFPNPFNPVTNIKFNLPEKAKVNLIIYDMLGKEVATLVNENLNAGSYSYRWDAVYLSSGVYFYKLVANGVTADTKKLLLLK